MLLKFVKMAEASADNVLYNVVSDDAVDSKDNFSYCNLQLTALYAESVHFPPTPCTICWLADRYNMFTIVG